MPCGPAATCTAACAAKTTAAPAGTVAGRTCTERPGRSNIIVVAITIIAATPCGIVAILVAIAAVGINVIVLVPVGIIVLYIVVCSKVCFVSVSIHGRAFVKHHCLVRAVPIIPAVTIAKTAVAQPHIRASKIAVIAVWAVQPG